MTDPSKNPAAGTLQPDKKADTPSEPEQYNPPDEVSVQHRELGGPAGPEPTRFGDWERKGRCIDF